MTVFAAVVVTLVLAIAWRRRRPVPFPARLTFLLEIPVPGLRHAPADLVRALALEPDISALEIGPGSGFYTKALLASELSSRLVCLDVQPLILQKLRARFGTDAPRLVCGDASALPFRAGSFDRILLVTVLGEIPNRIAALRECAHLLSKNGLLVVAETLLDADYIPARRLVREAADAGLVAVDRSGTWVSYTQRLARRSSTTRPVDKSVR